MIQTTRFPFVFWGLKDEPEAVIENNHIIKGESRYEIRESSVWAFLLAKYLPVAIGLLFIFTRFDFAPSLEKFAQYLIALVLMFLLSVLPKKYMIVFVIVLVISIVSLIVFHKLYFISFIFKYSIPFFIIFTALLDIGKKHYLVLGENKKIIANIIIKDL